MTSINSFFLIASSLQNEELNLQRKCLKIGGIILKIVGVLTDRDLMIRGVAENVDTENSSVDQVMSENVFYCIEDDSIENVADSMKKQQVRRLIVLDKDKILAGILALGDVATSLNDETLSSNVLHQISK